MRKLLVIFLLSFGLNGLGTNFAESNFSHNAELRKNINFTISIYDKLKEKDLQMSDLSELPLTSPIHINNIKRIGDLYELRHKHPILGGSRFHTGIDIVANKGTDVYSTANGVVEYIKYSRYRYGNQVVIKHNDYYETRYAHLNEVFVNIGDSVTRYTMLGTVGTTGLSTGPHLHYEILYNGVPINPLSVLPEITNENKKDDYLNVLIKLETFIKNQLFS